jgi:hypothetical protein
MEGGESMDETTVCIIGTAALVIIILALFYVFLKMSQETSKILKEATEQK